MSQEPSFDDLLAVMNWNPEKNYRPVLGPNEFPSSQRISMLSPPGHGKTTTVSGLFMRSTHKVGETVHQQCRFCARPLENASSIYQDVSNLSMGLFPAKTQTYLGFRSSPGLLLEQFKEWSVRVPLSGRLLGGFNRKVGREVWHKARQISFNDLPGETLSQVQWQYRMKQQQSDLAAANFADMVGQAIMEMRSCNEFAFILNCAKARGLGLPIEDEIDPNVPKDPDVSQVRQLDDIANHKARHGEKINAVYVILACWDKLELKAKKLGFDMFDPNLYKRQQILEDFTRTCFFQFFGMLHSCGVPRENIHYYPTFFQTIKEPDPARPGLLREKLFNDEVEYFTPSGQIGVRVVRRPHIIVKDIMDPDAKNVFQNARQISYSGESFDAMLNDMMATAPTVRT